MIRTLWASVQGDPVFMRRFNGWCVIGFFLLDPVATVTGWVNKPAFISHLSIVALVLGALSAWQAARVEVAQSAEAAERERAPVEQKVVDALVERTTVEPSEET